MQRNEKDKIDLQVKRALNTIKPAYNESLWEGIANQLPPEKRSPFAMYWRSMAAVLLLTAGVSGLYMMNNSASDETKTAALQSTQNSAVTTIENTSRKEKSTQENPATQNQEQTTYNTSEKNASAGNAGNRNAWMSGGNAAGNNTNFISKNNSNFNTGKGNHSRKNNLSGRNKAALNAQNQKDILLASADDNSIYTNGEKYLDLVELEINAVENTSDKEIKSRYSDKDQQPNPNKKRKSPFAQTGSFFNYAFWNNAAYTGAQGKLNLSFDDKTAYLGGEKNYSEARNNFGIEYKIPKSRFGIGLYHQRMLKSFSLRTVTGFTASARLFNIGKGFVTAGAGVSRLSSKLFKNNLKYSDEIDARAGFIRTSQERDFTSVEKTIGADAGIWYHGERLVAGFSAQNINQPQFGRLEQGERLRREWQMAAAYSIPVKNFEIKPFVELKSSIVSKQASAMVLVSYKNKVTLGAGYMNISETTRRGDLMAQASTEIKNSLDIYVSYGQNMQLQKLGLQQNIITTGLRYKIK